MKAYHYLLISLSILLTSCSSKTSHNRSVFEKRLYTKGYHFKGFDFNKNKTQDVNSVKDLTLGTFQSKHAAVAANSFSKGVNKEVYILSIEPISINKTTNRNNAFQKQIIPPNENIKTKEYSFSKTSLILEMDTIKSSYEKEELKKEIVKVHRNYLLAAILLLIFPIVGITIATIAMSEDRQLNKEGFRSEQSSLERIETLVKVMPIVVMVLALAAIAGFILITLGLFIPSWILLGAIFLVIGALGFLAFFFMSIMLFVNLIRKTVEFRKFKDDLN